MDINRIKRIAKKYGSPKYIYDTGIVRNQYKKLLKAITYPHTSIHYAMKANSNREILNLLKQLGSKIEAVSLNEIDRAIKSGFKTDDIRFTCSNIDLKELTQIIRKNIHINIDSLGQLEKYGKIKKGGKISIRINQGIGAGHHSHVITGGALSKFGIELGQINEAKRIAKKYDLTIIGIHQHIGSNVLDSKILLKGVEKLLKTAEKFDSLEFIDIGGGFGIPYKQSEKELDIKNFGEKVSKMFELFSKSYGREIKLIVEPGRYLIGSAGILLIRVTDIKETSKYKYVGVNSGFNHLIRPVMYGSYHKIINLSNLNGKYEKVTIAGNICESGDIFARNRLIKKCREGDFLAIMDTGAYGYSMSSDYNLRLKPREILIEGDRTKII